MNGAIKFLLGILILAGLGYGGYQLWDYWGHFKQPDSSSHATASAAPDIADTSLPGMPPKLEPMLANARNRGAQGLHDFLLTYGRTISDPRLASIQLDYVVLVAKDDPNEARKIFSQVKSRTSRTSPVYPRIQMLEKTYE